jgi:hypothetical protein
MNAYERQVHRQERSKLLTGVDAGLALGVDPATLRDWTRRGLLTNRGTRRAALYDVEELVAALDQAKPRRTAVSRTGT